MSKFKPRGIHYSRPFTHEALTAAADALPFRLEPGGPWLAGGFVLRCLHGLPTDLCDLDIVVNRGEPYDRIVKAALTSSGWGLNGTAYAVAAANGSTRDGVTLLGFNGRRNIDVMSYEPAQLGDFDLTCTSVAWDGEELIVAHDAILDVMHKALRGRKPVADPRWNKWVALGFHEVLRLGGPAPKDAAELDDIF